MFRDVVYNGMLSRKEDTGKAILKLHESLDLCENAIDKDKFAVEAGKLLVAGLVKFLSGKVEIMWGTRHDAQPRLEGVV
jgi:hypothetical protein